MVGWILLADGLGVKHSWIYLHIYLHVIFAKVLFDILLACKTLCTLTCPINHLVSVSRAVSSCAYLTLTLMLSSVETFACL